MLVSQGSWVYFSWGDVSWIESVVESVAQSVARGKPKPVSVFYRALAPLVQHAASYTVGLPQLNQHAFFYKVYLS